MKNDPIYVIGHRNPDADAICSAIGYAHYKQLKGYENCVAGRCGNTNARIDAILNKFNVSLPEFISDLTPRVRDIMVTEVIKVRPESTCSEALELIDDHDVRVLPVVNDSGKLMGSLSIFDLGEYFIPKPREERKMRYVYTSIRNIVDALKAKEVTLVNPDEQEELFVRIGAMDIRSFGNFYSDDRELANRSIIVVGDRYDIQQRSIQSGVRMLVISGDLPVEQDVVDLAKERGVSIIISPNDSATTSWIIRSAGLVQRMLTEKTRTFSPDEKLQSVRRKVATADSAAYMVVDDDGRLKGVFTKTDLLKPIPKHLIMVDHNELSQAVPGADQINILEIVDHHRLGNPPTQHPILFLNSPVGSTSTIVGDLFRKDGLTPSPEIAGILMGGIISDTLHLNGPTTTETDSEILKWLSSIAGQDAASFAEEIFSAGSIIQIESPETVIRSDMKTYHEGGYHFSVSQVEELGYDNFWEYREALDEALESVREQENLRFAALLVTDINSQNSLLLIRGDETVVDNIMYPHRAAQDVFELNGVVSRKKQLIPYLTTLVQGLTKES